MTTRQQQNFTFVYHDFNNVLDTTTPAVVTSDHPEIATATLGTDGRSLEIVAQGTVAGTAVVSIACGANPGMQNHITVAVTAAPDLSSLGLQAGPVLPKP